MAVNRGILNGLPNTGTARLAGGIAGQVLVKRSNDNFDTVWGSAGLTHVGNNQGILSGGVSVVRGIPNTLVTYNTSVSYALTANRLGFHVINLVEPITISAVYAEVTVAVASSNLVLGVYEAEVQNNTFVPTRLVTQFGTTVSAATTGIKTVSGLNVALAPRLYALAFWTDSAISLRNIRGLMAGATYSMANSGTANVFNGISLYSYSLTYSSTFPPNPPTGAPTIAIDSSGQPFVQCPMWMEWIVR